MSDRSEWIGDEVEDHETQESICAWANTTFGAISTSLGTAARANKEMSELLMALALDDSFSGAPEEAADVIIVLMRIFDRFGTTWQAEVDKKMKVNRGRKWHLDGKGHGYHVEEAVDDLKWADYPTDPVRADLADDRIVCLTHGDFTATWSEEDGEYVGTCLRYPSLSWLDPDPYNALHGIQGAVHEVELDDRP